jgi:hypothetical protein
LSEDKRRIFVKIVERLLSANQLKLQRSNRCLTRCGDLSPLNLE